MSDNSTRPTAPSNSGFVPRYGMYAGPNYAGGQVLGKGETPDAAAWRVPPVGYLDDVTRNHDINYTYIEQTYQGKDPASQEAQTQAFWQADKEMLKGMLGHQPSNWLEAQYRNAAIQAFVAKADMGYRPAVDVVGDWNRELASIDPKFPAMQVNEQGRATWSLPGLMHAGATYTSTGMEALSTSGVNSQVAVMFNEHIRPGNIAPQKVNSLGDRHDPSAEADYTRRLMIPKRDPESPGVFTADGMIDGKEVGIKYHSGDNRLVRTVSSNGQIESQTTYQGVQAAGPAGERYKHADFTVTQQNFKNGQPDGEPVAMPQVKAAVVTAIEQQESAHTRAIKAEVTKGKDAQYPAAPTEADTAWHTGKAAENAPEPKKASDEQTEPPSLSLGAQRLMNDSERHVRALSAKHQLPWDKGLTNTVAAVARDAQSHGLTSIDHLTIRDGQIRHASQDNGLLKEGSMPARQAANIPSEQSVSELSNTAEKVPSPAGPSAQIEAEPLVQAKARA